MTCFQLKIPYQWFDPTPPPPHPPLTHPPPPYAGAISLYAVLLPLAALSVRRRAWWLLCLTALAGTGCAVYWCGVKATARLGTAGRWELALVRHGEAIPPQPPLHAGLAAGAALQATGIEGRMYKLHPPSCRDLSAMATGFASCTAQQIRDD